MWQLTKPAPSQVKYKQVVQRGATCYNKAFFTNIENNMNLTTEQYEQLSAIYPKLCAVINRLETIVKPEIVNELREMEKSFSKVFEATWDAEEDDFDENCDKLSSIAEEHGFVTVWSVGEVPATLINTSFSKEKKVVISYESWGKPVEVTVERTGKEGITWLQMWEAADKLVKMSGDGHHVFVEDFMPVGNGKYSLFCGS